MKTVTRILSVCCLVLLLLAASACEKGGIPRERSEATAKDFLLAFMTLRGEDASLLMHPSRASTGEDLNKYNAHILKEYGVDSSKSPSILKESSYTAEKNREGYGGAYTAWTFSVSADGKTFSATVEIVLNDDGYGVYNFHFDFAGV
jgi:hypothetical protein